MAEQFLDGAQIRAFFKQMRTERVAQRVRMHICRKPAQDGDALYDSANAASGQPCVTAELAQPAQLQIDEQRRRRSSLPVSSRSQARRPLREVRANGLRRCVPQRHVALLLALAAYENRFVG